jgi:FkbM family methyltransferase
MISYAQNFEDVILARAFANISSGFYVDVGAWDPTVDSVTRHFYDSGWSGINIEPNPLFYEKLVIERTRDLNLSCAVSDAAEQRPFFVFDDTGTSTFDQTFADHFSNRFPVRQVSIVTRTLSDILCEVANDITFLKIDVEGWERQVIRSLDWEQFRPLVVVVEAVDQTGNPTWSSWEDLLFRASYNLAYFDGLNRFYAASERSDLIPLLSTPPNVFDNFVLYREQLVQQELLECQRQHAVTQQEVDITRAEVQSFLCKVHNTMTTDIPVMEDPTVDSTDCEQSLLGCVRTAISVLDEQIDKQRRTVLELVDHNAALRVWAGEIEQARAVQVASSSLRQREDNDAGKFLG